MLPNIFMCEHMVKLIVSICVLFPNVHVGPLFKLEGLILKIDVEITTKSPFCLRI
jgi:hypothetical protein